MMWRALFEGALIVGGILAVWYGGKVLFRRWL